MYNVEETAAEPLLPPSPDEIYFTISCSIGHLILGFVKIFFGQNPPIFSSEVKIVYYKVFGDLSALFKILL